MCVQVLSGKGSSQSSHGLQEQDLSSGQSQHLCLIFTEPAGAPTLTALGQGRTYPVSRWGLHQSKSTLFPKVAGQQDDSVTKEGSQGGKVSRPGK